eukprot:m.227171 g.227171  ORF g.227171 m.227171 type:complete len:343 (+) comp54238_c0_seq2:338-1366(+)
MRFLQLHSRSIRRINLCLELCVLVVDSCELRLELLSIFFLNAVHLRKRDQAVLRNRLVGLLESSNTRLQLRNLLAVLGSSSREILGTAKGNIALISAKRGQLHFQRRNFPLQRFVLLLGLVVSRAPISIVIVAEAGRSLERRSAELALRNLCWFWWWVCWWWWVRLQVRLLHRLSNTRIFGEQINDVLLASHRSKVERSPTANIASIELGTMLDEEFDSVKRAVLTGVHQARLELTIDGVHVGGIVHKRASSFQLVGLRSAEQRRVAIHIRKLGVTVVSDESLQNLRVAVGRGVVKSRFALAIDSVNSKTTLEDQGHARRIRIRPNSRHMQSRFAWDSRGSK